MTKITTKTINNPVPKPKTVWTPKTLADRTGVSVPTLHFYEQKGLITAIRTHGNQRRYPKHMARRIAFIQAGKKAGITLEAIKATLDKLPDNRTPTVDDWTAISRAWEALINERIEALVRLRDKFSSCVSCGCLSMTKCQIYNPDDTVGLTNQAEKNEVSEL